MELTMLNIKTTIPAIKLGQDPTTPTYLTHKLQKLAQAYEPCFLEDLGETSLMFLVHPTLTDAEIQKTCDVLDSVLKQACR